VDVAIAVVNWNVRDLLIGCLASVFQAIDAVGLQGKVWVIDNASSDGSVQAIREHFESELSATPEATLHLIASPANLWFGGAQNLAMRAMGFTGVPIPSNAEMTEQKLWIDQMDVPIEGASIRPGGSSLPCYVLVLNPDTLVHESALGEMVRFMDRTPEAGVCGPRLVYGDGRFQHAAYRFPSLAQCFFDFWPIHWRLAESRLNGRYARRLYEIGEAFPIDHPLGAAMLFRREVIEQTGGFDLSYRMYVEEIDWCMRVKRAGWDIYCTPSAQIVHFEGQSTKQVRPEMVLALWKSRYNFFCRYYSPIYRWLVQRVVRAGMRAKVRSLQSALNKKELDEATAMPLIQAYRRVAAL
jgi:GT2 family glycosyltransferase